MTEIKYYYDNYVLFSSYEMWQRRERSRRYRAEREVAVMQSHTPAIVGRDSTCNVTASKGEEGEWNAPPDCQR